MGLLPKLPKKCIMGDNEVGLSNSTKSKKAKLKGGSTTTAFSAPTKNCAKLSKRMKKSSSNKPSKIKSTTGDNQWGGKTSYISYGEKKHRKLKNAKWHIC